MFHHTKPRYSINDLCDLLDIGRARLYADINSGRLQTHKVRKRRFSCPDDVDQYVALCRREGSEDNDSE